MDSIKKKMQSLANETASAVMKFEKWEKELNRINENADSLEEQVITKCVNLCLSLLISVCLLILQLIFYISSTFNQSSS